MSSSLIHLLGARVVMLSADTELPSHDTITVVSPIALLCVCLPIWLSPFPYLLLFCWLLSKLPTNALWSCVILGMLNNSILSF